MGDSTRGCSVKSIRILTRATVRFSPQLSNASATYVHFPGSSFIKYDRGVTSPTRQQIPAADKKHKTRKSEMLAGGGGGLEKELEHLTLSLS